MFSFLRRRRSRNTTVAATRPVIEALESRQFLDATTFTVANPDSVYYHGVVNQADPSGQWVNTWSVSQNNVPDHSHSVVNFQVQIVSNLVPDGNGGLIS